MITIDMTPEGLLLRTPDMAEPVLIARSALEHALAPLLAALLDQGRVSASARRMAYEDGLAEGYRQAEREAQSRAEKDRRDVAERDELLAWSTCATTA